MVENKLDYNHFSKEELIDRITEIEEVMYQMKIDLNQKELLTFPWVGNLGLWYWMVPSNELLFNDKKATNLGYSRKEIPKNIGFEYFTTKLHPDDYEKVMKNMRDHLLNRTDAYEVEYRIQTKKGDYKWYYDRGKVTKRDESNKPLVVSGIVFDISKNKEMENELKEANEQLKKLVIKDELTGAFNKRFLLECIQTEIEHAHNNAFGFSIIMLDIDYFKWVNDSFGHHAGDRTLQRIVEIISNRISDSERLFRYGGDEFVVLLPSTTLLNAVAFSESVRLEINNVSLGDENKLSVSIGVSSYNAGDTTEELLKKVDNALYNAKENGRNCVAY